MVGLYRNIGLASAAGLSRALFAFGMTVIIARALGPVGRGQFAFATNLAGLASLVLASGAGAALIAGRRQLNWDERQLVQGASAISGLSAILVIIILALSQMLVGLSLNDLMAGLAVPLIVGTTLLAQAAQIRSRFAEVLVSVLLGPGLAVILITLIWRIGHLTISLSLLIWLLTMIPGIAVLYVPMRRNFASLGPHEVGHIHRDTTWLIKNSLKANVPAIATLFIWRIDLLMIQWFRGDEAVGHYSIAVGVAETLMVVSIGLRTGLVAHLADTDRSQIFEAIGPVFRAASAAMSLVAVTIAILAPVIIRLLFGESFDPATASLRLLVLGIPFLVLHYPLVDLLLSIGKARELTYASISLLLLNFVINSVALKYGDVWMAAAASTMTYVLLFLWVFLIARSEFPVTLRRLLWPYPTEWKRMFSVTRLRKGWS